MVRYDPPPSLVICVAVPPQPAYLPIRDEVVGEAGGLKRLGRLLERRAERRGSRAAEMREPRFSAHGQRLVERVVHKDIGVGTSGLHERLDARHIRVERGEVVPPRVPRIELDAGIELPARPRIPTGEYAVP